MGGHEPFAFTGNGEGIQRNRQFGRQDGQRPFPRYIFLLLAEKLLKEYRARPDYGADNARAMTIFEAEIEQLILEGP
jgi:hypothetical protein